MDWRIIAAALAVIGVLAGGTLLAAQVQGDLDAGVDQRLRDSGFKPPTDTPPLKLNDFKLPKSMPMELPEGTKISPDLSKMTLPEDMDITLPEDLDLSGLDFELPEDFDLSLPPGTEFSAPDLKLPEGATIRLPDGREFKLPPGSELTLPPELVQRLLDEGLPAGTLPTGRDINIRDLPPDLVAQLDPPAFDGKGQLHLPAGTEITLPDGTRLPFPAGALAYAARYLLPPGTSFDIPFDSAGPGGGFPVPMPLDRSQLIGDGPGVDGIAVDTEITSMPARVRKGEPVTVSGYVRERASGRPIAGAPVDIFMNESKRVPGDLVGQCPSDAAGTFVVKLALPAEKPARDYQLVNHAAAFVSDGRVYADGWGDPPFATYATTNLTLELPETDGFGASTPISGSLLDNTGAGVPGAVVVVSVDGTVVARPLTTSTGRWSLSHTFPAGTHTVGARFAGTANYEASNTALGTISIEDYAIQIPSIIRAKPGDGIQLRGTVLYKGGPADGRTVVVGNVFGGGDVELSSNLDGTFSYAFSTSRTQPPGTYVLTYALPAYNVQKTQLVELNQTGRIELTAPASWDIGREIPVTVRVMSTADDAIPSQNVRLTLSGPGGSRDVSGVTDWRGAVVLYISPLRAAQGTYTLTARVVNSPNLEAATVSQQITLGSFDVAWSLPASVVRGQDMSGSATLRLNGRPYTGAEVVLDVFGPFVASPDSNGIVRFSLEVPTVATLGTQTVSLTAPEHDPSLSSIQVVAVPKLTVDAPERFDVGTSPEFALTLVDDQGDPIRNAAVALEVSGAGPIVPSQTVYTDSAGRWKGSFNLSGEPAGNLTLKAWFAGGGPYLADEDVRAMSAVAPTPFGAGAPWWLLPIVGIALAGGAGGAWWYMRQRPRRVPVQAVAAAPVAAPVLRPSDVALAFGIAPGEPAVWGIGEPLELRVKNDGERGSFRLAWPGGERRLALDEGAGASATLTFPEEGDITLTATREGTDHLPAEASVRIVDYRKETAREFDLFLDKARGIDGSLTKRSTPREISWTLAGRLGVEAAGHLDEIALVLEVTNYSHYQVTREHYLRFVRAARALDPLFSPAPAASGS